MGLGVATEVTRIKLIQAAYMRNITSTLCPCCFATVGYGDVVLQPVWRLLGPVESVSGVLMCGLSASFLFAVVTRLIESSESTKSHR